jgi:hypothetical protein
MFVKSVVWSAASQVRAKAEAETTIRRRLDPAFRVPAAMLPIQEYKQIYTEWERGEREDGSARQDVDASYASRHT